MFKLPFTFGERSGFVAAALFGALLSAMPVLADDGGYAPVIQKVTATPTVLVISGTNFGTLPPVVTMGGDPAPVINSSPTTVTVAVPNSAHHAGTYLLKLTVHANGGEDDRRSVKFEVTIPPTHIMIAGNIHPDGTIPAGGGTGFTSTRLGAGSYRISFPSGTFPGNTWPTIFLTPLFVSAPVNLRVVAYIVNGDGSAFMDVNNSGVDVNFFFLVTQS